MSNIRLYRGLTQKFNSKYDISKMDAPHGYSTWTDSLKLAKEYAGPNGYIYYIDLPLSEMGASIINEEGDRVLFYLNDKPAGLHGVKGKEYLVYTFHDLYNPNIIKEYTPVIGSLKKLNKRIFSMERIIEYNRTYRIPHKDGTTDLYHVVEIGKDSLTLKDLKRKKLKKVNRSTFQRKLNEGEIYVSAKNYSTIILAALAKIVKDKDTFNRILGSVL